MVMGLIAIAVFCHSHLLTIQILIALDLLEGPFTLAILKLNRFRFNAIYCRKDYHQVKSWHLFILGLSYKTMNVTPSARGRRSDTSITEPWPIEFRRPMRFKNLSDGLLGVLFAGIGQSHNVRA